MTTMAQLQYSPLAGNFGRLNPSRHTCSLQSPNFPEKNLASFPTLTFSGSPLQSKPLNPSLLPGVQITPCAGGGDNIRGSAGSGGWSGGGGGGGSSGSSSSPSSPDSLGLIGILLSGWRSRVAADPQFPFKVLMEEIVGVSACVLGDMASRPNFGLNELDFVFSTLVVGSILNFTLMYLLAPTMSSTASALPSIFANCPTSHMFEPGAYSLLNRFGTFVYKGTVFAAVGFAAGLVGTTLSNGLIKMRKKMDPSFEPPNKPPPTVLNALTWALHMGLSSNLRYQTLNGLEFLLAKGLPPFVFKTSVVVLRCLNNVLGGVSFVLLARLTGSQNAAEGKKTVTAAAEGDSDIAPEKVKLLNEEANFVFKRSTEVCALGRHIYVPARKARKTRVYALGRNTPMSAHKAEVSEVYALGRHIFTSVHKARRVIDQIRGRSLEETLMILDLMPYRACSPILKLVRSAAANARSTMGSKEANLVISKAEVSRGRITKRSNIRAKGRCDTLEKTTCHITIVVKDISLNGNS